MHRILSALFIIALLLAACSGLAPVAPAPSITRGVSQTPVSTEPGAGAGLGSAPTGTTPPATLTPFVPDRSVASATAVPPATPENPGPGFTWLGEPSTAPRTTFEVRFHPDGGLYTGDYVSMEVIAPDGFKPANHKVTVALDGQSGASLGTAAFGAYGLGGRVQATMLWVWDTATAQAGEHTLTFTVQPDGPIWNETVTLRPRGQLPPVEQGAHWAQAENRCCRVHYITGTAAERDLPELLKMFDAQAEDASQRMETTLSRPVEVTLLPRVIGNGGFADGGISISYLDRDYSGGDTAIIFHHELIHILDARLGGDFRPPFLVEGLAVYASGGHFKPEPLMPRAAALLPPEEGCAPARQKPCSLGLYIPLSDLVKNFYVQQHEIGYLEAASLIEFMVDTWGWKAYSAFYRDIHLPKATPAAASADAAPAGEDPAMAAVEDALQRHFGLRLPELERRFVQALRDEPLEARWVEDVRLELIFHDRGRGYQKEFDLSTYFLNAWLPSGDQMRLRGIVADYLRGPDQPENLAIEAMLTAAGENLQEANYLRTGQLEEAVTMVLLDRAEAGKRAFQQDPLAADYYALVDLAVAGETGGSQAGPNDYPYQPQRIEVGQNTATVWASSANGPELAVLNFLKVGGAWRFLSP